MSGGDYARFAQFPGGDLIAEGLDQLKRGDDQAPAALLLAAGATRLRAVGVPVPAGVGDPDATTALYHVLGAEHGDDAHGRYLALIRQLESFARAAEHAARR